MLDLHHDVRYINTQENGKITLEYFLGFLNGVIASDYDIEKIYIDGIPGLLNLEELEKVVENVISISEKESIDVVMSVSETKMRFLNLSKII